MTNPFLFVVPLFTLLSSLIEKGRLIVWPCCLSLYACLYVHFNILNTWPNFYEISVSVMPLTTTSNLNILYRIWGYDSGGYEEYCLLGYNTV
jgi:hypothetical protein